jgi:hypothetical protein
MKFKEVLHVMHTKTYNIGFWWGSLREGDHWGDPDVDGRILLRGIFKKLEGVVGTGWTGGGHL